MTKPRYSSPVVALHWMTLVLVLAAVTFALYREYILLQTNDPSQEAVMSLHMSIGIVAWILTVLRFVIRTNSTVPPPIASSPAMALVERGAHFLLYAFLLVMPLVGLASAWIRGRPFTFFGMFTIPSPLVTEWKSPIGKLLEPVHLYAAHAFLMLAGLHALVALYHHLIRRDQALLRIMPRARRSWIKETGE